MFGKTEERLNLCVPGGKETARMLKALCGRAGKAPAPTAPTGCSAAAAAAAAPAGAPGRRATIRSTANLLSRTLLNKPGSEKETWHVEFDLTGCGIDYEVGDAFGLFPANDPALVDAVIKALGAPPDFPIGERTLREVLIDGVSLSPAPDMLFQLFSYITGGERRQKAKALSTGEDPDGDAATLDVLAAIEKFPGIRPDPEAFIEALDPLQPRLYSISSSPKPNPGRVTLTVDTVRYKIGKRKRLGVASTFLADRIEPGATLTRLCAEGACLRPAGRSERADHHGRPRHRRRAVPRLPARAHGDQGAGPELAVLRPPASRSDFFYEDELNGDEDVRRADAAVARLVARQRPEDSTCRTACARSAASCGRGSPKARTSTSAATPSAWPRTSSGAGRHRRAARRAHDRRGESPSSPT